MARNKKTEIELPEVSVSDDGEVRHLHLGTPWIQGSMRVDDPFALELEYVQRMMAWLLFVEPTSVTKRHVQRLVLGRARVKAGGGAGHGRHHKNHCLACRQ